MGKRDGKILPRYHGVGPIGVGRYLSLYTTQIGWLGLGAYLFMHAYWPSTCQPNNVLEVYGCSARLAETRSWVEAALMTWLWTTPILLALEISRRWTAFRRR